MVYVLLFQVIIDIYASGTFLGLALMQYYISYIPRVIAMCGTFLLAPANFVVLSALIRGYRAKKFDYFPLTISYVMCFITEAISLLSGLFYLIQGDTAMKIMVLGLEFISLVFMGYDIQSYRGVKKDDENE
jgi:hypothetical protein